MQAGCELLKRLGRYSQADEGRGRATVQQFHIHGAKVIALDLNQPEDPEEPFPEEVVFLQGSVECVQ